MNGSQSSDDLGIVKFEWTRDGASLAIGTVVGNTNHEPLLIVRNHLTESSTPWTKWLWFIRFFADNEHRRRSVRLQIDRDRCAGPHRHRHGEHHRARRSTGDAFGRINYNGGRHSAHAIWNRDTAAENVVLTGRQCQIVRTGFAIAAENGRGRPYFLRWAYCKSCKYNNKLPKKGEFLLSVVSGEWQDWDNARAGCRDGIEW